MQRAAVARPLPSGWLGAPLHTQTQMMRDAFGEKDGITQILSEALEATGAVLDLKDFNDKVPVPVCLIALEDMARRKRERADAFPNETIDQLRAAGFGAPTAETQSDLAQFADFALLAYEDPGTLRAGLLEHGFELLANEPVAAPHKPAHYVAYNMERKVVAVGVKGTSSMSDVATDSAASKSCPDGAVSI